MAIGSELHTHFRRIVQMSGGDIRLLEDADDRITIGFVPGRVTACESGACVLPHVEVEEMMREWLARRAPAKTVKVQLLAD